MYILLAFEAYFFDMNNSPEGSYCGKVMDQVHAVLGTPIDWEKQLEWPAYYQNTWEAWFFTVARYKYQQGLIFRPQADEDFGGLPISYNHFLSLPKKQRIVSAKCILTLMNLSRCWYYDNANITAFDKYIMCDCTLAMYRIHGEYLVRQLEKKQL